jgi:hypothetical protein
VCAVRPSQETRFPLLALARLTAVYNIIINTYLQSFAGIIFSLNNKRPSNDIGVNVIFVKSQVSDVGQERGRESTNGFSKRKLGGLRFFSP